METLLNKKLIAYILIDSILAIFIIIISLLISKNLNNKYIVHCTGYTLATGIGEFWLDNSIKISEFDNLEFMNSFYNDNYHYLYKKIH